MTIDQDKETLLDALYARYLATGERPSVVEAKKHYLPEWDDDRILSAARTLEAARDILNPRGTGLFVDLSSTARQRAATRAAPPPSASTTINIGSAHNSPIQHVAAGAYGVQTTHYQVIRDDLQAIVEIYRQHVDELKLDSATRRRADAQVATIEAQLLDEPDATIVKAAGKSLKTIVEGAIGGAIGNAIANPGVWAPLFSFFS